MLVMRVVITLLGLAGAAIGLVLAIPDGPSWGFALAVVCVVVTVFAAPVSSWGQDDMWSKSGPFSGGG